MGFVSKFSHSLFWVFLASVVLVLRADLSPSEDAEALCKCEYLENENLSFVCQGIISEQFAGKWGAVCPPAGETYSIWRKSPDYIMLVAFYDGSLLNYESINIRHSGAQIYGRRPKGQLEVLDTPQASLLCFGSEVPYITELERDCLGQNYRKHIFHYTVVLYGKELALRSNSGAARSLGRAFGRSLLAMYTL